MISVLFRWDLSHPDDNMPSTSAAEGAGGAASQQLSAAAPSGGARHKRRQREELEDDGRIEVAEYVNVPDYGLYPSQSESEQKSLTNNSQKGKHLSNTKYQGFIFVGTLFLSKRQMFTFS